MHPDKQAKQALTRAIREAGNMRRLSEKTGVCYSIINSFNSGKSNICNIPLGTLMRIFPDLSIRFFKEDGSGGDSQPLGRQRRRPHGPRMDRPAGAARSGGHPFPAQRVCGPRPPKR